MKKAFLLTLLVVVAASAVMTITFPSGAPTKVGVPVSVLITSDAGSPTADLFVNPENKRWVVDTVVNLPYNGTIRITHPGAGLTLYASRGADNGESESFDVVVGEPVNWQILAPGEINDGGNPANPSGKTGSAAVTAGADSTYDVNLCDVWYNVIEDVPTAEYTIGSDDPFEHVDGDVVELRRVYGFNGYTNRTVSVSGGAYERDESNVRVNVNDPVALLLICPNETHVPGDDSTSFYPGKSGDAGDAAVDTLYIVDIYAVDTCWNITPSYEADDVNVYDGSGRNLTDMTSPIVAGKAEDVAVDFITSNANEKIYAEVVGGLETKYNTDVNVRGGADTLKVTLIHESEPVGVHATLQVEAVDGDGEPVRTLPISVELIEGNAEAFHIEDEDDTLWTNESGIATTEIWADTVGDYEIRISGGDLTVNVTFSVYELGELVVYPNPFKYSADIQNINFKYEVGEDGADEVLLLIVDLNGNVAYKATYTSGDKLDPGFQVITWDVKNSNDVKVASGLYQAVLRIKSGLSTDTHTKNFIVIW